MSPYDPATTLSMSSSTVDFNTAGARGGGIWGATCSTATRTATWPARPAAAFS
jgi:hypothetical protein